MRCIVIDVGNTSTGIGLYDSGKILRVTHIKGGIAKQPAACDEAVRKAARGMVCGAVLGSVVPRVNAAWQRLILRALGCKLLVVKAGLPMDVTVDYPAPETIGADRLADACGGVRRYGAPLIVADFGTALTFDIVTKDLRYVGGVITPGLPLMTDYLYERTALLPRVELEGPCPKLGRSTLQAMRIGAQIGYRGIVREIVSYLQGSLRCDFKLVATGGYAGWALKDSGMDFVIDQELTLFGLGCIFEKSL
ncbi:MAG TPA: type III pantothenate kinase [Kiritimatiellia bacterium]|nr:type III pantothenate kinase [Kiritimatiellia bacterium]HPS09134.1 type III pantothenate kinase [Kiritimatiellia bacterium]